MPSLESRAWLSVVILGGATGLVLFLCAGSIRYWQAWVYLALSSTLSAVVTLDLLRRDPALLERRMKGGPAAEQRPVQRLVMLAVVPSFVALLVIPGLDHRFRWSTMPLGVVLIGDILFIAGFLFVGRVFHENTYASATIGIAEGQQVISTGPYGLVRHPMYTGALVYLLGTPIALGSYVALVPFVVILLCLVWRIVDEEQLLEHELRGYNEYRERVRYRLVPYVW